MTLHTTPQIAVLMPVYNPGDDLKLTLVSLRAQTVPFRLFLVDDGSKVHTDYESLSAGMDVKIIRLPQNVGITGAMNAGLKEILSQGFPYIARIDCGDVCTSDRFEKQKSYLDGHPNISILGSACEFRDRSEQHELLDTRVVVFPISPEDCRRRLFFNSPVCHPVVIIRRSVFEKIGLYSEAYPAAEDYDLMWRASLAGFNIANLNDMLLIKEVTPGSISLKRRRRQIFSRLCIQWANVKFTSLLSLMGIVKTILIFLAPSQLVTALKKAMPNS
jgi:GT2 family glycosyltransferase